jgi:hypothetical protein
MSERGGPPRAMLGLLNSKPPQEWMLREIHFSRKLFVNLFAVVIGMFGNEVGEILPCSIPTVSFVNLCRWSLLAPRL